MLKRLVAVLAVTSMPFFAGCAPECVDLYDCAAKAKADKKDYTCESGVCKAGTPFVATSADGGTP